MKLKLIPFNILTEYKTTGCEVQLVVGCNCGNLVHNNDKKD